MKVVSFNVNSVRMRLHQLQAVVDKHQPEFIGLQETKVQDHEFPVEAIQEMGYHAEFHGGKTHYGVALLSKTTPLKVQKGFPDDGEEAQRRIVMGTYATELGEVTVINGYFPQGENREHPEKFPAKKKFYEDLQCYLEQCHRADESLLVMGDFNIAPVDADIGIGPDNAKRWLRTGKTSFLPEEREWMKRLENWGLEDTYRHIYPDSQAYFSWFDYRSKGFQREPKRGLRIDHILATEPLLEQLCDSGMDYDIRSMEKPSDHCPVWSEFCGSGD
ncbi:MAG: exodeoxyribonuclease III [bacterium]